MVDRKYTFIHLDFSLPLILYYAVCLRGFIVQIFFNGHKKKTKHIHLSNNSLFDFAFGVFIFNISCWESTIICIADNAYIYIYISA